MQWREVLLIVILPKATLKVVSGDLLRDQTSTFLRVGLRAVKAVLHLIQVNACDMLRFAMVLEDTVPEDAHFATEWYLFRVCGFDIQLARLLQYLLGNQILIRWYIIRVKRIVISYAPMLLSHGILVAIFSICSLKIINNSLLDRHFVLTLPLSER